MKQETSIILVPTDFSEVALSASIHAGAIASHGGDSVCLLHIITKDTVADLKKQNKSLSHLEDKLKSICDDLSKKFNVTYTYLLKEGSIFTTIGETATEINAKVMVLGTHGVVGVQKIVGAYALKVVESSKIPVIIVQERLPINNKYLHIVSPVDGSVETKQKTLQTITIAKLLNAKVYLYRQKGFDEHLDDHISLNEKFIVRYLNEHKVEHEVVHQEKVSKNFAKDFLAYSTKINADMIVILTTADKGLKDIVLGPEEQMVINNEQQIPVMCVNPLQNIYRSERLASAVNLSF